MVSHYFIPINCWFLKDHQPQQQKLDSLLGASSNGNVIIKTFDYIMFLFEE